MNSNRGRPVTIDRARPVALHHQLREVLVQRISRMRPGERLPSVRELIAAYGVSLPVVRRALADLGRDGVVESRPGSGTFLRKRPAPLRSPVRRLEFVFCGEAPDDPFTSHVLSGVEAEAAAAGYEIGYARWSASGAFGDVDGAVLAGIGVTRAIHDVVRGRGVPVVVAGELAGGETTPGDVARVEHDNRLGGRLATGHLTSLGHRRIAHVGGVDHAFWAERRAGYLEALRAAGVEPDERWIVEAAENTADAAYAALRRAWRSVEKCTAFFCANDRFAAGACRLFAEKGARVPAEVSVVGFDDLEVARNLAPPLTTVHIDMEELGRRACRLLLGMVADANERPARMVLPLELVTRGSTAPRP